MNQKKEAEAQDIDVPDDHFKPFNVEGFQCCLTQIVEENRKYMNRAMGMFEIPSLAIPKYRV